MSASLRCLCDLGNNTKSKHNKTLNNPEKPWTLVSAERLSPFVYTLFYLPWALHLINYLATQDLITLAFYFVVGALTTLLPC